MIVALALRLYDLGDRPFHHDESQDAYFSWIFWKNGDYEYDPLLHGPLRFYLTAAMYTLFGDSDFTARLAPALMGTLMVPLPYLLRRQLGRVGAFSAAVMLAIGPSFLYFSRFAREDIYIAAITLGLLVVVFRFLDRPRKHHPALIGALLALSFATKETTFITVFVAGTFFLVVVASRHRELMLGPVRAVGRDAWGWGLAAFVGVFTVLFTTFLTHPGGLWDGIYTGLKYWLSQHEVRRGGESDGLLRGPAVRRRVAGAAARRGRRGSHRAEAVAVARVPDLGLRALARHLLLGRREVRVADPAPAARRCCCWPASGCRRSGTRAFAGSAGWGCSPSRPRSRTRPMRRSSSTPSTAPTRASCWCPRSRPRRRQGRATSVVADAERADREGRPFSVTIDSAEGATFPWAWYFRDLNTGYIDLSETGTPGDADAIILTQASRDRLRSQLREYSGREFPFRVWWVREYDKLNPGSAWRWLTDRTPWNETGGMPEWHLRALGAQAPDGRAGLVEHLGRRARPTSPGPRPRRSCARSGRRPRSRRRSGRSAAGPRPGRWSCRARSTSASRLPGWWSHCTS